MEAVHGRTLGLEAVNLALVEQQLPTLFFLDHLRQLLLLLNLSHAVGAVTFGIFAQHQRKFLARLRVLFRPLFE